MDESFQGLRPRRRSPPVPESGRNYDCDSPCTSPPSLRRILLLPKKAVKRQKVTNVIHMAEGDSERQKKEPAAEELVTSRNATFGFRLLPFGFLPVS